MREGSEALLAFLVLLGVTLLLIDLRTGGSAYDGIRSAAVAVVGPLQAGVNEVTDPDPAAAELLAENQRLRSEQSSVAADRARLAQLESLFGLVGRSGQTVVAASVVAMDAGTGTSQTATIDRGSDDGIEADQAVLAGSGLAGRVLSVAPHASVVLLASDPRFVAGARLTGSGQAGIVRGTGDPHRLTMELLDPLTAVSEGETVTTIGSPGSLPFPPGLVVATVSGIGDPTSARRELQLRPAAAVTGLSVVGVVVPPGRASPAPKVAP